MDIEYDEISIKYKLLKIELLNFMHRHNKREGGWTILNIDYCRLTGRTNGCTRRRTAKKMKLNNETIIVGV